MVVFLVEQLLTLTGESLNLSPPGLQGRLIIKPGEGYIFMPLTVLTRVHRKPPVLRGFH